MSDLLKQEIVCYLMMLFSIFCIIFPQYVRNNFSVNGWDDPGTDFNDPKRKRTIRIIHGVILIILLFVAYHMFWKIRIVLFLHMLFG